MSVREISFDFLRNILYCCVRFNIDAFAIKFLTCIVNVRELNASAFETKTPNTIRENSSKRVSYVVFGFGRRFCAYLFGRAESDKRRDQRVERVIISF